MTGGSLKWRAFLLVALVGSVLMCFVAVSALRHRHWFVVFDGPKDAMLTTWHPRLYLALDKPPVDGAEKAITFGMVTYKREFLEEDVPVSAMYVVVDRKQLLSGAPTRARSYILWDPGNDGFVGNIGKPTVKATAQEIEVALVHQGDGQYTLNVISSDKDSLPITGSHSYEIVK